MNGAKRELNRQRETAGFFSRMVGGWVTEAYLCGTVVKVEDTTVVQDS